MKVEEEEVSVTKGWPRSSPQAAYVVSILHFALLCSKALAAKLLIELG